MTLPLVIFGHSRPHLLSVLLERVASLETREVIVVLDGPQPNHPQMADLVRQTRDVARPWCETNHNYSLIERTENLGARLNISSALSEFFKEFEELAILEDDCLPNSDFLSFLSSGLRLASNERTISVGTISGFTYLNFRKENEGYWVSKRLSSWGWATTRRVWRAFEESQMINLGAHALEKHDYLVSGDPALTRIEYAKMRKNRDTLDAWDIPFDMFLRSRGMLTVKPLRPLVKNVGFGRTATHTKYGRETPDLQVARYERGSLRGYPVGDGLESAAKWALLGSSLIGRKEGP